jgi:hypothetical protein
MGMPRRFTVLVMGAALVAPGVAVATSAPASAAGVTSGTVSGDLHGTDYGDNVVRGLDEGVYDYTVKASGGGELAFSVEEEYWINGDNLGEKAKHNWPTIEKKSKIRSGSTLSGQFTTHVTLGDFVSVRFNFNREFLSDGVDYTLTFHKR